MSRQTITKQCMERVDQYTSELNELFKIEKSLLEQMNQKKITDKEAEYKTIFNKREKVSFLNFSEKKSLDNKLEAIQKELSSLKNGNWLSARISDAEKKKEGYISKYKNEIDTYLRDRFPYEKKVEEYKRTHEEEFLTNDILNVLFRNKKRMTVSEIQVQLIDKNTPPEPVIELLRKLTRVGRVGRSSDGLRQYYQNVFETSEVPLVNIPGINADYEDPVMKEIPIPDALHVTGLSDEVI